MARKVQPTSVNRPSNRHQSTSISLARNTLARRTSSCRSLPCSMSWRVVRVPTTRSASRM